DPDGGGQGLGAAQGRRLLAEIGSGEEGGRHPADGVDDAHAGSASGGLSRMVRKSVCTLPHSWICRPCFWKKARTRSASQPTMSSRIGTSTLRASYERIVHRATAAGDAVSELL